MDNTKRLELTITALKQSLGKKIADAEEEIASIRAEASLLLEDNAKRIGELEQENAELKSRLEETNENVAVSSEDA
ncbi:hypothetical protein SEA_KENREY_46 [Streptomyces phage Kenrey]|nr:hypothetical protein SEA_KENREY_46 [Streptomyces phage Kenrey]